MKRLSPQSLWEFKKATGRDKVLWLLPVEKRILEESWIIYFINLLIIDSFGISVIVHFFAMFNKYKFLQLYFLGINIFYSKESFQETFSFFLIPYLYIKLYTFIDLE